MRDKTITESFTLTKAFLIVQVSFEYIPIWLAVLSPIYFRYLCFIRFSTIQQIKNVSFKSSIFVDMHVSLRYKPKIILKKDNIPSPNLVLLSGCLVLVKEIQVSSIKYLTIFVLETKGKTSFKYGAFKVRNCRIVFEWRMFQCSNNFGISLFKPPYILTYIKRCLGDFIDYYDLPTSRIKSHRKFPFYLPSDILDVSNLSNHVVLPCMPP